MAVYVDTPVAYEPDRLPPALRRYGLQWCHMMADDLDQLHEAARRARINPEWFQPGPPHAPWKGHYDLTPRMRYRAKQRGALAVSSREMLAMVKAANQTP
jgi:hypothetical protein